jgi:hypothetical protein
MVEENNNYWDKSYHGIKYVLSRSAVEVDNYRQGREVNFQSLKRLGKKLRIFRDDMDRRRDFSGILGDDLYEAFLLLIIGDKNIVTREVISGMDQVLYNLDNMDTLSEHGVERLRDSVLDLGRKYQDVISRSESYRGY